MTSSIDPLKPLDPQLQRAVNTPNTAPQNEKQAKEAATKFEAMLFHQMFSAMWENVPKDSLFGDSQADSYYRDMLNEALSDSLARTQSLGVGAQVLKEFKKAGGENGALDAHSPIDDASQKVKRKVA